MKIMQHRFYITLLCLLAFTATPMHGQPKGTQQFITELTHTLHLTPIVYFVESLKISTPTDADWHGELNFLTQVFNPNQPVYAQGKISYPLWGPITAGETLNLTSIDNSLAVTSTLKIGLILDYAPCTINYDYYTNNEHTLSIKFHLKS